MKWLTWLGALTGVLGGVLATGPALAQAPAYVGTWASELSQCNLDQSSQAAPLVLTATSYDQHEAHCKLGPVRRTRANVWRAAAVCLVEGSRQKDTFVLTVAGDELALRDGAGARLLRRCRRTR
ncbi:MAG: hypothetical protein AB7O57_21670 [Hyphomicrobiaceae bacterium]